ncbi:hypothetical protein RQL81_19165 [Citrobacter braakii]|jgi:hypothetical protein|uniref:hypothetical protein n=1 Tax=Enterobacteriaceae TaxID=543 RepID=UPI000DF5FCB4|nr:MULTISPECIES: hypothetical protein [Enterobacteriaceae]MCI1672352.1 hypothetical protein [Citrobacter freundii]MDU4150312.1 hypothetical protein [Enterobacteriaceae bacterium]MCI1828436.1 hypothetical protein [Citrobacter freundii]MDT7116658.1 hypothetical protein [Citrobacter braakii]QLS66677.1 hypothetical protein HV311_19670 [Citrobacter sp. RHBSTW-00881]
MGNPLVPQGFLNRVRGALSVTDVPALNVTASYLGKDGISMRPDNAATDIIPTMTGTVGSQTPYQQVTVTVHLLKTQGLGASYQQRFATDTALGEVVITPDATTFGNFTLLNCYLLNFNELPFNGMDAGYVVTIGGYLTTNDNMWI